MMKISTLLAVAGISIASTQIADAQTNESPWTFGVKAGANIANTSSKNESGRIGFNVGGTVEYKLSDRFFLQSGLEFTSKGSKLKEQSFNFSLPYFDSGELTSIDDLDYVTYTGKAKASQNLMFLQIPLTIGYRLPLAEDINLTFNIGGYAGYGIAARSKYKINGTLKYPDGKTESVNTETTYKKYNETGLERFDYGLLGGIGIEYKKFSFNVNYELGLRNLDKSSGTYLNYGYSSGYNNQSTGVTVYEVPKWKNRNVSLSVGYKF